MEILSLVTDEAYSTSCPNRPGAVPSYETGKHSLAINGKDFYTLLYRQYAVVLSLDIIVGYCYPEIIVPRGSIQRNIQRDDV